MCELWDVERDSSTGNIDYGLLNVMIKDQEDRGMNTANDKRASLPRSA